MKRIIAIAILAIAASGAVIYAVYFRSPGAGPEASPSANSPLASALPELTPTESSPAPTDELSKNVPSPALTPKPQSNPVPSPVPAPQPAPLPAPAPKPKVPPPSASTGRCAVPAGAGPEDISHPTSVVGDGTPVSCTAQKVIDAVHAGGVVTFDCGPDPIVIKVPEIKIYNNGGKGDGSVTIDGGNKVTLAAAGANRIFYQNTCDQSLVWTSSRCDTQSSPHLALQNITITGGRGSAGSGSAHDVLGGGAVYVRGGTFKAYGIKVASSVQTNASGANTQDLAGGAIYAFGLARPATVVNSVFSDNSAANGGAIGGIMVSYTIVNSVFTGNRATGHGMNPAQAGTFGGGLGGAIYNDGNSYALNICGSVFSANKANELGSGAIFMVANDLRGELIIDKTSFSGNSAEGGVQTNPGIYAEAADKRGIAGVAISQSLF